MTVISLIKQNITDISKVLALVPEQQETFSSSSSLSSSKKIQLQLHANCISNVPISFFSVSLCSRLVQLDLSSNRISKLKWLSEAPTLPVLLLLNLSNNGIEKMVSGMLIKCPALRKLNLSHNKISDLTVFQEVSGTNHPLLVLDLRGNRIKEKNQLLYLMACQGLEALYIDTEKKIGFAGNSVCREKDFSSFMFRVLKKLVVLDGRNCDSLISTWREPNYFKSTSILPISEFNKENKLPNSRQKVSSSPEDNYFQMDFDDHAASNENTLVHENVNVAKSDSPFHSSKLVQIENQLVEMSSLMRDSLKDRPESRQSTSRLAFEREKDLMNDRIKRLEEQLSNSLEMKMASIKGTENTNSIQGTLHVEDLVKRLEDEKSKYQVKESTMLEKLKRLTIELTNSKAKVIDLERSKTELSKQNDEVLGRNQSLTAELNEQNVKIAKLKEIESSLNKELEKSDDLLIKTSNQLSLEEKRNTESLINISYLEKALDSKIQELDAMKKENVKVEGQVMTLKTEILTLKNQHQIETCKSSSEIDGLRNKVSDLKRELEFQEKTFNSLKSANSSLEEQLRSQRSETKEKLCDLERDSLAKINSMAEKVQWEMKIKYETEISQKNEDLRKWANAYEALQQESSNLTSIKLELETRIKSKEKETEELKSRSLSLLDKNDELECLVKELTRMAKEQKLETTNTKSCITERDKKIVQLETNIKDLNEMVQATLKEKTALQEALDRYGNGIKELDSLRKKNNHLEGRLQEIDKEYLDQISHLESKIESKEDALKVKTKMLDDQNETITSIKERLKEKTALLEEVGREAMKREEEMDQRNDSLEREVHKLQDLVKLQQDDLSFSQDQLSQHKLKCQEACLKASKLQANLSEKENQLALIESEFQSLCDSFSRKEDKLRQEYDMELGDKETIINDLKKIVENYKNQFESCSKEAVLLKSQVTNLLSQNTELIEKCSHQEDKISNLEKSLKALEIKSRTKLAQIQTLLADQE